MHQCVIQWHGDDVEVVRADESVSIATADLVFWELGDFECLFWQNMGRRLHQD